MELSTGKNRITIHQANQLDIDTESTSMRADDNKTRYQSIAYYYSLILEGGFCYEDKCPKVVKSFHKGGISYIATDWHLVLEAFKRIESDVNSDSEEFLDKQICLEIVEGDLSLAMKEACRANLNTRQLSPSDRAIAYMSYLETLQKSASELKQNKYSANQLSRELYQKRDEIAPRILRAFFAKSEEVRDEPPNDCTRFLETGERVFVWAEGLEQRPFRVGIVQTCDEGDFYQVKDALGSASETMLVPRLNLFPLDLKVRDRSKPKKSQEEVGPANAEQAPDLQTPSDWRNEEEVAPLQQESQDWDEEDGDRDEDPRQESYNERELQKLLKENEDLKSLKSQLEKRNHELERVAKEKQNLEQQYQDLKQQYEILHQRWQEEVDTVISERNRLQRENEQLKQQLGQSSVARENINSQEALADLGF